MTKTKTAKTVPKAKSKKPTEQPKHVSDEIKALSSAWIAGVDASALIRILGVEKKHQAYVRICRYRHEYGTDLFPHRKEAMATGGYSASKVNMISKLWKSTTTYEEIADKLGCSNTDSIWGIITHLRTVHGEAKFPHRRKLKQ